jgi:hypothetical protein
MVKGIRYLTKDIETLTFSHLLTPTYKLDIVDFMKHYNNKERFFINKKDGFYYFRGDEPKRYKDISIDKFKAKIKVVI